MGESLNWKSTCLLFVIIGITELGSTYEQYYRSYPSWIRQEDQLICPQPTGQFNHPKYCDLFLNCWKGDPTVDKCSGGLVFNEKIAGCDYPRNVDCKGRGNSKAQMIDVRCKEPFGTYPNPNNCSEYFVCQSGVVTIISCPENTYYNSELGICTYEKDPRCIDLNICEDPYAPGCPPQPAGSPTLLPTVEANPTVPFKPKPSLIPEPPNPEQAQFEEPGTTPTKPEQPPTSQEPDVVTVNLKPKPPLKPQNPTSPEEPTIPQEIIDVKPEEPSTNKPPPLKPGSFKPIKPGGPSNVGPSTPRPTPEDGEDDPSVLFPFLPAFPNSFKCPIPTGILPVLGDCESIIACINNEVHFLRCPEGYNYDIGRGKCGTERSTICEYSLKNKRNPSKILYVSIPSSKLYEELNTENRGIIRRV